MDNSRLALCACIKISARILSCKHSKTSLCLDSQVLCLLKVLLKSHTQDTEIPPIRLSSQRHTTSDLNMTQATSLENLPTELSIQIMLDVGSLNALYAVICASPRMLQVFCANKADILSHIARGSFHSSALLEALSIADMNEMEHPLPRSTAIQLLRVPIEERRQRLLTVTSTKQSTAICKLKSLTTFFVKDYAANTLPILDQVLKCTPIARLYTINSPNSSDYSLSKSEHARIERAFCRFELYALYFGQCIAKADGCLQRWDKDTAVSAQKQAELFLFRYSASEVAEILCVRDYLHRRLHGVLNDVEDHAAHVSRPSYFKLESKCATGGSKCPRPFQSDGRYDIWTHLEHITSLGLGYVRSILEAKTEDERTDLMLHGVNAGCHREYPPAFLRSAALRFASQFDIKRTDYRKNYKNAHGEWSQAVHDDNGNIPPSPGWEWAGSMRSGPYHD